MKFILKFEATRYDYVVSRIEVTEDRLQKSIATDILFISKSRGTADAYFTHAINNISKELFSVIETSSSSYKAGMKPISNHVVFKSSNLLDLSRFYASRL